MKTFSKIAFGIMALGYISVAEASVLIEWKDRSNNESGFIVESRLFSEKDFTEIGKLPADSVEFLADSDGKMRCYRVGAFNRAGTNYSQEKCVDTPVPPNAHPNTPPNAPEIRILVTITVKL